MPHPTFEKAFVDDSEGLITQRKEIFCLASVLPDATPTKAARIAGLRDVDYGATLMKDPRVIARIKELRSLDQKKTIGKRHERLEKLTQVYRTVLSDLMNEDGTIRTDRAAYNTAGVQAIRQRTYFDKNLQETVVDTTVNLRDPIPAIVEHNKMDGSYAPEKHLLLGDIKIEIEYVDRDKNELQGRTSPAALPPG